MSYAEKLEKNKIALATVILACWTAYGLFFGAQSFLRAMSSGRSASLLSSIVGWLICGYCWALLTIPLLRFIRRFSLERLGWSSFLLVHIFAAPMIASIALALYVVLATALLPWPERSMIEFYRGIYLDEILSEMLVYLLMVGVVTVYYRLFRHMPEDSESVPLVEIKTAETPVKRDVANGYTTGHSVEAPLTGDPVNGHLAGDRPLNGNAHGKGYLRRISIKDNGRITLVDIDDVKWISSYGNYLKIHTSQNRYIYRETMTAIEQKLDPQKFVRIRRSAIVRVDEVRELRPISNGEYDVVLKNDTVLASTRRYRKNLEALIQR